MLIALHEGCGQLSSFLKLIMNHGSEDKDDKVKSRICPYKNQTNCSWSSLTIAQTNRWKDVPWQHSIFHISVRLDSLTCPFKIHQPFRESTTDTERVNSSTPSRLVPYIKAAVASDVQVIGMAWRGRTDLYTFFGEEEGFYIYFFSPPQWGFMKNVSSVAAAAAGSNKGCTEEQRHLSLCLRAMVSPQNLFIFNYTLIRLTWVK